MTALNMEDATYVALAQLTQAAIESAPMDESGNVILMSYEDIQKSMQEIQAAQEQQEQQDTVDISLHDIQIAQQHETGGLQVVHEVQQPEEFVAPQINQTAVVLQQQSELPTMEQGQVELNVDN